MIPVAAWWGVRYGAMRVVAMLTNGPQEMAIAGNFTPIYWILLLHTAGNYNPIYWILLLHKAGLCWE